MKSDLKDIYFVKLQTFIIINIIMMLSSSSLPLLWLWQYIANIGAVLMIQYPWFYEIWF